jgi:hypothetical protein
VSLLLCKLGLGQRWRGHGVLELQQTTGLVRGWLGLDPGAELLACLLTP